MKRAWLSQWFTYCSLVLPVASVASCQSGEPEEVSRSYVSAEHHAPWDQQQDGVVTVHSRSALDQEILKHQNGDLIVMWGVEFCKYCHKMYQTLLQLLSMYPRFRVIVFDFTPLWGQRSPDILRNGRYVTATPYSEFYRKGQLLGTHTGSMLLQDILDLYNWAS